jgi:hypothetical protein
LKSQELKVKEFGQRKEKNYAEVAEDAEIAEKRKRKGDGNTEVIEGRTEKRIEKPKTQAQAPCLGHPGEKRNPRAQTRVSVPQSSRRTGGGATS